MTMDELKLLISDTKMACTFYAESARSFQKQNGTSDDYNLFLSEKYTKYVDAFEELEWYKKQDLVPRDVLINALNKVGLSATQLGVIYAVPKAELPKGAEWWNRSPDHEKFDYNEPFKTESMVSAERLIKDAGGSQ